MARAINRTVAIALAAGLALSGAAGTSATLTAPASAQTQQTIGTDGGTLTVHKYLNPEQITESTQGQVATDLSQAGSPMPGAIFTATRIDLDLTDPVQFEQAAELTPQEAADRLTSETFNGTTDDNGQAVFDLPLGAYLIRETPTDEQLAAGLIPAAPFIAYMPMTTPDGSEWNRDVHVYPKNTELATEKSVVDADQQPATPESNTLTYTINSTVPVLPENRTLTSFSVVDTFNSNELLNPEVTAVTVGDTTLEAGTDYTVTEGTATGPGDANASLTIELSADRVAELTGGQTVSVTLTGEVAEVGEDGLEDGELVNNAFTTGSTEVTGQAGWDDTTFTTPEDSVTSYFGKVLINKVDEEAQPVTGTATFDLYKIPRQGEGVCAGVTDAEDSETVLQGFEVVNGAGEINALHVTDIENDTEAITDTYCLVETEAPAGFLLDDTPIPFTLTREDAKTAETVNGVTYVAAQRDVVNRVQPALTLPMTGGSGVMLLIIAGLLIVGGGAYAARRNSA